MSTVSEAASVNPSTQEIRGSTATSFWNFTIGLVPENYIGGGRGGITLNQWNEIKDREDIEIAAPIASIGYFTSINATIGVLPSPEQSSTYQVEYSTSEGVND